MSLLNQLAKAFGIEPKTIDHPYFGILRIYADYFHGFKKIDPLGSTIELQIAKDAKAPLKSQQAFLEYLEDNWDIFMDNMAKYLSIRFSSKIGWEYDPDTIKKIIRWEYIYIPPAYNDVVDWKVAFKLSTDFHLFVLTYKGSRPDELTWNGGYYGADILDEMALAFTEWKPQKNEKHLCNDDILDSQML